MGVKGLIPAEGRGLLPPSFVSYNHSDTCIIIIIISIYISSRASLTFVCTAPCPDL